MVTRVEVESESMRPVRESMLMRPMLDASLEFDSRQARIVQTGKDTKMVALDGPVFTNEELTWMMRRLPLRSGYKVTVPTFTILGMTVKLELTASGPEEVTVPAGKFRCFKVEVVGQSIWVSSEGTRPVVKTSAMGVVTELVSVRNQRDLAVVNYRDEKQR
ncbi:MAG: hypothetical protein NTY38_18100, partial [Acidobacteria bacterium]|nr:hypothetical protein [Acidobacteriota bacterium]